MSAHVEAPGPASVGSVAVRLEAAWDDVRGKLQTPGGLTEPMVREAASRLQSLGTRPSEELQAVIPPSELASLLATAERLITYMRALASLTSSIGGAEIGEIGRITAALSQQTAKIQASLENSVRRTENSLSLQVVAAQYGKDAERERGSAHRYKIAMAISILLALALLLVGLWRIDEVGEDKQGPILFAYFLSAMAVTIFLCWPLLRMSERRRNNAEDLTRLQRQLSSLEAYIAPLPDSTQALLRATLAPRVFARGPDDVDPLREPLWPNADQWLSAIGEDLLEEAPDTLTDRLRGLFRSRSD